MGLPTRRLVKKLISLDVMCMKKRATISFCELLNKEGQSHKESPSFVIFISRYICPVPTIYVLKDQEPDKDPRVEKTSEHLAWG